MAQKQLWGVRIKYTPWDQLNKVAEQLNLPLPEFASSPLKYQIFVGATRSGMSFHQSLVEYMSGMKKFPDIEKLTQLLKLISHHLTLKHRGTGGQYTLLFSQVVSYFRHSHQFIHRLTQEKIKLQDESVRQRKHVASLGESVKVA